MRPRVGVTGPDFGGLIAWIFTAFAILRAGGRPVRITPRRPRPLSDLDGLVIGGGVDIAESLPAPSEDFQDRRPWTHWFLFRLTIPYRRLARWWARRRGRPTGDEARDRLEAHLLRKAREASVPTLGICRGAQLMARVEGGTLAREVGARLPDRENLYTPLPRRWVDIEFGSRLAEILGGLRHRVNSLHKHAVQSVPSPLRCVAREHDAPVIQAIEDPTRPFWIGVQWHPEYLPQVDAQRGLFDALVETARQSEVSETPSTTSDDSPPPRPSR